MNHFNNRNVLLSNRSNLQKVIGIDISMGNYAAHDRDQANQEAIRKYWEGKGQPLSAGHGSLGARHESQGALGKEKLASKLALPDDPFAAAQGIGQGAKASFGDDAASVNILTQKYGHGKTHNKKRIAGVVQRTNVLNNPSEIDPTRPKTFKEKHGNLEKHKQATTAQAIQRLEAKLAGTVRAEKDLEFHERQLVRDSLLKDFQGAVDHKRTAHKNNNQLKKQVEQTMESLQAEIAANIEHEKKLNHDFLKDDTLRCAFPRIHAPTDETLNKEKKSRHQVLANQYDSMIKDREDRKHAELAQDKDLVLREAERVDRAAHERDQHEVENKRRVNEECVREWELRLKAKEFLRKIKKNTVKQLNMIMQDGNNSNVKFEKAKHTQFGRKGMGHYNQICLMAKTAQSFRSGQEEQDKAQEKEVPVHVRLFGKKASPKEGYKSDNRDWQKGLRGKANNEINEYETGNYLSDAAYAKKKQLELLQMQMGKEMAKGEHTQVDGDDYQITS